MDGADDEEDFEYEDDDDERLGENIFGNRVDDLNCEEDEDSQLEKAEK